MKNNTYQTEPVPAWGKERIAWETVHGLRTSDDKYGYSRTYSNAPSTKAPSGFTILAEDIEYWGNKMRDRMVEQLRDLFPASTLPEIEHNVLKSYLSQCPDLIENFLGETLDGFLYCRQVTCPHCGGEAPLLNTCWLSREAGKEWGVKIITDGRAQNSTVRFGTYRVTKGKGPNGEDPNFATVKRGIGACIHCRQAIDADEIKRQARGESEHGTWQDRLYCIVAVRFFRPANETDLDALKRAELRLRDNWDRWDKAGLIPTERFPQSNDMRPVVYGMTRWCDMFTPRQLLGHLTLVEELNRLKPRIIAELGENKGRAVVTYLQFAIDKGVDYNSRQTR